MLTLMGRLPKLKVVKEIVTHLNLISLLQSYIGPACSWWTLILNVNCLTSGDHLKQIGIQWLLCASSCMMAKFQAHTANEWKQAGKVIEGFIRQVINVIYQIVKMRSSDREHWWCISDGIQVLFAQSSIASLINGLNDTVQQKRKGVFGGIGERVGAKAERNRRLVSSRDSFPLH